MRTDESSNVVLFLDFDGVLHPRGGEAKGRRFSKLFLVESLLREPEMGHISIVISSTWRAAYSLKSLISVFSDDIRPRIIGTTPILDDYTADFLRYREIREWLHGHPNINHWIALDDAKEEFPQKVLSNVVLTNPEIGLEESEVNILREALDSVVTR